MHEVIEVEGTEDGNKGKGFQIDTGALGVDGNCISQKMANKIDKFRKHRVTSDELRIGLSGA